MAGDGDLSNKMSQKTTLFGLRLWVLVGITVGIFIALILFILSLWLISRKKLDRLSAASNAAIAAAAAEKEKEKEKKRRGIGSSSSRFPFSLCKGSGDGSASCCNNNSANHSASSAGNSSSSIPAHSKEIKVDRVVQTSGGGGVILTITDSTGDGEPEQVLVRVGIARKSPGQKSSLSAAASTPNSASLSIAGKSEAAAAMERQASAPPARTARAHAEGNREAAEGEGEEDGEGRDSSCSHGYGCGYGYGYGYGYVGASGELGSASGLSSGELGFGWGHWFTLRELQIATNGFSSENVLGEGGYGIVYKGKLPNDTMVAVKSLLNNMGQAEREFRVEVEAIGRVRHKNLVRFLGYCIEGTHRMLVYEYVDNGNLEQWLHGSSSSCILTWENRMRIIIGTAKALAYLHEALEPKVVHRDIKASNILIDSQWNAKVSDFGLAKMLGAGKSHVTTRVMGTFGYVAPEYASTGLLNERSDVYSFGVLVLETITGRDPVDYSRPTGEVNLLDWLKVMVGNRRSEEVVDPKLSDKPAPRVLKKVLLIALRCVDPESEKRPRMGHVVHMLESEDFPYRDARSLLTSSA